MAGLIGRFPTGIHVGHALVTVVRHPHVGWRCDIRGCGPRRRNAVMQYGKQQQGSQRTETVSHTNRLRQGRRNCKTDPAGGLSGGLRQSEM